MKAMGVVASFLVLGSATIANADTLVIKKIIPVANGESGINHEMLNFLGSGSSGSYCGSTEPKRAVFASAVNTSPDDLYITANGNKIWPPDAKYLETRRERREVNLQVPLDATISLWDWDRLSSDDELGQFTFNSSSENGFYCLGNPKEGSLYYLEVERQER